MLAIAACGSGGVRAGLDERPVNQSCVAPPAAADMPERLGSTGCFDPVELLRPAPGLIPYSVNVPLWSDGADKRRYLALPPEGRMAVASDGDLDLPAGTVLAKVFLLEGAPIETRLFVRHRDEGWAGYSYAFTDDGTDALLVGADAIYRMVAGQEWQFPSRQGCLDCHTEAAGRSLGLELAQLERDHTYANGRTANQVVTFSAIGLFDRAVSRPAVVLADPADADAPLDVRARSYLHANCANCHRPEGVREPNVTIDLRFGAAPADLGICGLRPNRTDLGIADAMLLLPGDPARSILSLRMHSLVPSLRMPPLSSSVLDPDGTALVDAWIRAMESCP
jgi:uncharacterized repeat protein (TIGR03806 family)